jgi:hypothetical protein
MSANIESETLVLDRSTDPADVKRIFFDHDDLETLLSKQISRCETRRPGAYDRNISMLICSAHVSLERLMHVDHGMSVFPGGIDRI